MFLNRRNRRRSGVSLAEALVMVLVAGTLMVPVIGTLQQGVRQTSTLELRTAMQNFAESKMAEITYESLYQGIKPSNQTAVLQYPNATDPEYIFNLQVEVIPSASIQGDNTVIDGPQHQELCAVSVSVGLDYNLDNYAPDVATVSVMTMLCPPPQPPDFIYCAHPADHRISIINPMNHQLITEINLGSEIPIALAPFPNGKYMAVKCPDKILMLDLTTESYTVIYSATSICGASAAETGNGNNNAGHDRGIAFRSDGLYLYFTMHSPKKLVILKAPTGPITGSWATDTTISLNSDVSNDLRILDDGTLVIAQGSTTGNQIFRLNTHTNTEITTFAGGADAGSTLQLAMASSWGGNTIFARLGAGRLTSLSTKACTSFEYGTLGSDFNNDDVSQRSILPSYDNRWLFMSEAAGSGASAHRLMAFKLPLSDTSLQDSSVSRLVTRGPLAGEGDWTINQIEYSPYREELVARSTDGHVLFPNIKALADGAYGDLNDISPADLQLSYPCSDARGRLAEYVWLACSDNASHTIECLDLYGGNDTNGLIVNDNVVAPPNKPASIAQNAGGNHLVVTYDAVGAKPQKIQVSDHSITDFPNPLQFTSDGIASKAVFLLDGSLLVLTSKPTCYGHKVGDCYPDIESDPDDLHNGFVLYEAEADGDPAATPCLGYVCPGSGNRYRVQDIAVMHRTSGAYLLLAKEDQTGSILIWIEKSREPGFNNQTTTESYKIMGHWESDFDGFPGSSSVKLALSPDDTVLAIYDNYGNGIYQSISFYDLCNNHFPTTAGLNYLRYYDSGYSYANSDTAPVTNSYYNYPLNANYPSTAAGLPAKPQNYLTASTSLSTSPKYTAAAPLDFDYDVASNNHVFYSLFGYYYHTNANYTGFKSHDAVRFGWNGFYPFYNSKSGARIPWADNSGDQYFSYKFDAATGATRIEVDYFSNDDGLGAYFGKSDSSLDFSSGNWSNVKRPRAQDLRTAKRRPALIRRILLDGSSHNTAYGPMTLPDVHSATTQDIVMCFHRDSTFPCLFFISNTNQELYAYNYVPETICFKIGMSSVPFHIQLSPLSQTRFNDIKVSPDGRRLLIGSTNGTAGNLYLLNIAYDPANPGEIPVSVADHTILKAISTSLPVLSIGVRDFNSFSSKVDTYVSTTTSPPLATGYGQHRAAVGEEGIYLFGGAPGITAEPDSGVIQRIGPDMVVTNEPVALPVYLKDFAAVMWDECKILLFGGETTGGKVEDQVSIYDTIAHKLIYNGLDKLRSDDNSEKIKLRSFGAAATPFGPVIAGGVKGDAGAVTEITMSSDWSTPPVSINGSDTYVSSPKINFGNNNGEFGSAFLTTPITIKSNTCFFASFTTDLDGKDGVTFCVQNDTNGAAAIGGKNSGLGYTGINNSVAVWIDTNGDNGEPFPSGSADKNFVTVTYGGSAPDSNDHTYTPDEYHIYLSHGLGGDVNASSIITYWWVYYDGQRKTMNVWSNSSNNPETAVWAVKDFPVDLAAKIGGAGNSAYFGFTGATNDSNDSQAEVYNFSLKVWEKEPVNTMNEWTTFTAMPTEIEPRQNATFASPNLQLTSDDNRKKGALWYKIPFDLNKLGTLETSFVAVMRPSLTDGMDGMAFVIQGAGITVDPSTTMDSNGYAGINNSVAFILDTRNSVVASDQNDNHIAIHKNGDVSTHYHQFIPSQDMNDNTAYNWVWIEYDNPANNLRVYMTTVTNTTTQTKPQKPLINHVFSEPLSSILGTTNAYIGFTARTPTKFPPQSHRITRWKIAKNDMTGVSGTVTNEVKVYYPNAISGTGPAASSLLTCKGNATVEPHYLQLTPDATGQAGAIWLSESFPVTDSTSFSTKFIVSMPGPGDPTYGKGDGMVFVIQGNDDQQIGGGGNELGYHGISNSLAVELDCYVGGGETTGNNHISALKNGDELTHLNPATTLPTDMNDGDTKFVWIDYDGPSNTLKAYINTVDKKPGSAVMTNTSAGELTAILGGSNAWFGFTAACGLAYETHLIHYWELDIDNERKFKFPLSGETVGMENLTAGMMNGTLVTHYSRKNKTYDLYLIGPGSAPGVQFPELIYKYDCSTGAWLPITLWHASNKINIDFAKSNSPSQVNQRTQVAACSYGDEIFIFGGYYNGTSTNSQFGMAYNPDTNMYRELTDLPAARVQATAIPYGPYIYLIGGASTYNGTADALNTILRYKP